MKREDRNSRVPALRLPRIDLLWQSRDREERCGPLEVWGRNALTKPELARCLSLVLGS